MNQNSIQGEIESTLESGSACYNSVPNILSPSLLLKNIKIRNTELQFCLSFCMGVKLGSSR